MCGLWSVTANEPDGQGKVRISTFEPLVKYVKELDHKKRDRTIVDKHYDEATPGVT